MLDLNNTNCFLCFTFAVEFSVGTPRVCLKRKRRNNLTDGHTRGISLQVANHLSL